MKRHSIGIIGYGNFGAFVYMLFRLFVPWIRVRIFASQRRVTGRKFCSLGQVCQSDAVILAVPISAYKNVLIRILPLIRKDTVIVDVATVKVHTVRLLRRYAKERRWIAIHPMFGAESYKKTKGKVKGFRIAVCAHTLMPELYARVYALVRRRKFKIVKMDAHTHDRHIANTLFRTHYHAQTGRRDNYCRTVVDTKSFEYLMDAFEIIWHHDRLFDEVYCYNAYCERARRRIKRAERKVDARLKRAKQRYQMRRAA